MSADTPPTVVGGGAPMHDGKFNVSRANPIAASTGYTRAARAALANDALVRFRETFAKKILKTLVSSNLNVSSYKASEMDDKNNFFNAIASWSGSSLQMQSWMRTHFVHTVFVLMKMSSTTAADGTVTREVHEVGDLFKLWNTVTLGQVFESCLIYYRYADSAVESQNLNLSWEFLMMNIDNDLRSIVNAELSAFMDRDPVVAQSGPMAFYVIANRIIRCTTGLSHHVVTGVMSMGLVHFKGENVVDCVATLRNVLLFLGHGTNNDRCPPTLMKILGDVFLRCTNPVFVNYVRTILDFHSNLANTPEDLFMLVQSYYNELLMKPNGWLRTTKTKSAFLAELPELAAIMGDIEIKGEDEQSETPRSSRRGRGRRNQTNVADGTSTLGQRDSKGRFTHDRKGNPIDRNPPAQGAPTRRNKSDGSSEYWCGQCDRWGNHDDAHHEEFKARQAEFRNRRNNTPDGGDGEAKATESPSNTTPGSMHRANTVRPFISLLGGRVDTAYDTDTSF